MINFKFIHNFSRANGFNKKKIHHVIGRPTPGDVVYFFFVKTHLRARILKKLEIKNLIIDPGFGFGKTLNHNYEILNNLDKFKSLKVPILIGTSRKSMIYNLLECNPQSALNGTTVTNTLSLIKGANILRTHDVEEAVECVKIICQLKG